MGHHHLLRDHVGLPNVVIVTIHLVNFFAGWVDEILLSFLGTGGTFLFPFPISQPHFHPHPNP